MTNIDKLDLLKNTTVLASPVLVKKPILSVRVVTYNHVQFVSKCLSSVLSQETNFDFEIIVCDDCSNDGTIDVLNDLHLKNPCSIKILQSNKNFGHYTGSGFFNAYRFFEHARGIYYSFLEGDDYWTSNCKLQSQVDILNNNSNLTGTFHRASNLDNKRSIFLPNNFGPEGNSREYNSFDFLRLGNIVPSSSFVTRSKYFRFTQGTKIGFFTDLSLHFNLLELGPYFFLDSTLSVYRLHKRGIHSKIPYPDKLKHLLLSLTTYYSVLSKSSKLKEKLGSKISNICIQLSKLYFHQLNIDLANYYFKKSKKYSISYKNEKEFSFMLENTLCWIVTFSFRYLKAYGPIKFLVLVFNYVNSFFKTNED